MSTKNKSLLFAILVIITPLSIFSGYTSGHAAGPTATPIPFPVLILNKGDFYFSVDGTQNFIFSRNLAGYDPTHYDRLLLLTQTGGSKLIRVQLDSMGMGYTNTGQVDETWVRNWEHVFDSAAADGIHVIPVFAGWFDWNNGTPDYGYSTWKSNPLNGLNGGPAKTPAELFRPDSPTQRLWFQWVKTLVERWQARKNIAAWEIFSEVNIASGTSEPVGTAFVNQVAAIIRAADSRHRPITASLADVGEWPSFLRSDAIDFINIHPYPSSGQLDTYVIREVGRYLAKYNKPVLIGESGLSASTPDSIPATLTTAKNASIGISHAIWATTVSGAMNGRMLYWEDGFAMYFPALTWPFIHKYGKAELAAARFVGDVDFAGFKPLAVRPSAQITGGAVGSEKMIIGWFRDVSCEPPNWDLRPLISKQTVSIAVPGSALTWRVEFYRTETGSPVPSVITVTRQGSSVTIPLPDFTDAIAFKLYAPK